MNERHFTDDALDDQLRRFYQDVYEPMEPASETWTKLVSQLDGASPTREGVLTAPQPPARGSTMPQTTSHTWGTGLRLGSAVAILLTGIIITASLALFHMSHGPSVISINPYVTHIVSPQAYPTAGVPVTPIATQGPQAKYVYNIVTSRGVSTSFVPIDETSHFQATQNVYVVCDVHGIPKGQTHIISIHWFYDGQDLGLPSRLGSTYQSVSSDQVVYFRLRYPTPGLGMAKIFFDLPSTDSGDQANDPYLAAQITFAVDPAAAGTATASPTSLLDRPGTKSAVASS